MKRIVIAAATLASSLSAYAGDNFQHSERGEFYFGLTGASIDVANFDDAARSVGGIVGINVLDNDHGTISLDTFFARTIDAAIDRNNVKTDVNMAGVFAAYRMPTKVYGKARAGMVFSELDRSDNVKSDGSEFAWGAGIGAEIYFGVDLELEYTRVSDDVDAVSLSLIFGD